LTTLVLGVIADRTGNTVWSLEHSDEWGARVRRARERYRIASVHHFVTPLRDYGNFSWYAPPLAEMPGQFAMVVCDGPPGTTPGGRYGLLPVMGSTLAPGCQILLDDAARDDEKTIAARWAADLGTKFVFHGENKPYAELIVPRPAGSSPDASTRRATVSDGLPVSPLPEE
jgi:hypothetical protein